MRHNAKAEAALQAKLAEVNNARDWGRDHHHMFPDRMMVEVAREAAERFEDKHLQIAFLQGYSAARVQHDEWMRESEL